MRVLFLCGLLVLVACDQSPDVIKISGETMGTTYHVTVVDVRGNTDADALSSKIEATLADVNATMSNWDPGSEISRFNESRSTQPVEVSAALSQVMQAANAIHDLSEGKFDVTLAPLIDLWGFGPADPQDPIPSDDAIEAALTSIGQARVLTLSETNMAKTDPEVAVNLSAIAKGYGADAVAALLEEEGILRYLVEIGGDLYTRGTNAKGEPWSIGIETPDSGYRTVEMIMPISDKGMATSGDYRNYFEREGVRYSHIIDPTTGRPVTHSTASVTVIADSAMMADGLATAMLVLGAQDGLRIAEEHMLAVFFITREEEGFVTRPSMAFEKMRPTP